VQRDIRPATHIGVASLREEHVRQTRAALLAAGRARFGSKGFAATSVDDLAGEAGVTTGALYHHFENKTELFAAVFEQVHLEVLARNGQAAAGAATGVEGLVLAFDDFLDAVLEPDVRQIMITAGPSVLGLARFTELDERYALNAVVDTLRRASASGELVVNDPDALGHLLLGALVRGAMLVAASPEPRVTRDAVSRTIGDLLTGLEPGRQSR
jgi:AcrR family transcriptional regulator